MPIPSRDPNRYIVFKWADIANCCSTAEIDALIRIHSKVRNSRVRLGKPTREHVVVSNKNEDLYNEVWGMVLAEVERTRQNLRTVEPFFYADEVQTEDSSQDEDGIEDTYSVPPRTVNRMTSNISHDDLQASFTGAWELQDPRGA